MNCFIKFWILFMLVIQPAKSGVLHWLSKVSYPMPMVINNEVEIPRLSANGRYVTFKGKATNLVNNDTNGIEDVFWHDIVTGQTKRVNTTTIGDQLDTISLTYSAPTSDGMFVAFSSSSTSLPGANLTETTPSLYLKNMVTDEVINLSNYGQGGYFSSVGAIHLSDDAQYVSFVTGHPIDPLHLSGSHIYRMKISDQSFELFSLNASGTQTANENTLLYDVSNNGQYVLLYSEATDLTNQPINNSSYNLFLHDTLSQTTTLINTTPEGDPSNDFSFVITASVSNFGDVVYTSTQSDLVSDDNNGNNDVFIYQNGTNRRLNLNSFGEEVTDGFAYYTDISSDGTQVVFTERSAELVDNDLNDQIDIFIYDLQSDQVTLLSKNSQGESVDGISNHPVISADGNRVVFVTSATEFKSEPTSPFELELYYHQIDNGVFKKITIPEQVPNTILSSVRNPRGSQNQNAVIYNTTSPGLTDDELSAEWEHLYLLDRTNDQHQLLAVKAESQDISPSGRYVVFESKFSQPDGITDLIFNHIYLLDRQDGSVVLIDQGTLARVNDDGYVVFLTLKNISPQDLNSAYDVYGFDPQTLEIILISQGLDGLAATAGSPDIGGSGSNTWVVFHSSGDQLVPGGDTTQDIFVKKLTDGKIKKISQTSTGIAADGASSYPAISDNGRYISYSTNASNLTSDDYQNAGTTQVLYYDLLNQSNHLASINDAGMPLETNIFPIVYSSISRTGRYISYVFSDDPLHSDFNGDDDNALDIVLFDVVTQTSKIIPELSETNLNIANNLRYESQVLESDDEPPLVGVLFEGNIAGEVIEIDNHPGHREAFLYQEGGPDVILTVQINGPGSITGTAGINCSDQCNYSYSLGADISLIVAPDNGMIFTGWQIDFGICEDEQNLCNLRMDRSKSVSVTFIDPSDIIFSNGFD